jgi:short-subunit dehydrogenase
MKDLSGRAALVTGASGGLGRAIARRLAAEGAHVVVTGRQPEALAAIASECDATVIVADLARRDDVGHVLEAAGTVDIVVSNAGLPAAGLLADFTVEQIDRALDVNLRSHVLLGKTAAASMAARGDGQIVFMSSMGGAKLVAPGLSLYAAAKAGLRAFALALREDLRDSGVGVSTIFPGPISQAGMWADSHVPTPRGVRTRPPSAVADAVIEAIRNNRAEIDVASPVLRVAAPISLVFPSLFAALGRRADAGQLVERMTEAHQHNR